ncbi:CheA84a [Drosophila busckii]|uniref:CheA84a n=1 Tax=Drosophila busckii TaxID=30019 RepID=A0A0M4EMD3_DROBS|nr:uncharacterized protein LOC108601292 [Drosophila busckii]ALC45626.1 CheA84a [Drosophila busckii]
MWSLLLNLAVLAWAQSFSIPNTKYDIEILALRMLPGEQETLADISGLSFVGRDRRVNGTLDILADLDNEHFELAGDSSIDVSNGGGNFIQLPFMIPRTRFCDAVKKFIAVYGQDTVRMGVNTDFPVDGSVCPIPKGTYYIKNVKMNADDWPLLMPRGIMKSYFRVYKDGKSVGSIECLLNAKDKL